jgi:rhodanese-related sulfurtransferase
MEDILATELQSRLQLNEQLNILDVREPIEYHSYNIKGINIPLGKLIEQVDVMPWNRDAEIIIICKLGLRSQTAKSILENLGYLKVRNLHGGLIALQKMR